jgi:hypothetical protein
MKGLDAETHDKFFRSNFEQMLGARARKATQAQQARLGAEVLANA